MPGREPTVSIDFNTEFENKHLTKKMTCGRVYHVRTPSPRDPDMNVEDMGAVARALEGIISDAINNGVTLRAYGGAWSLSEVAFSNDWLLDTLSMNLKWRMRRSQVRDDYPKDFTKLYLFQCGNSIQEVNDRLEGSGNSLPTCGASNGQTIAGAVSTCTHGSAFQYGSMTEYVVGIHLVAGPSNTIWLERASHPIVTDEFIATIGARLVRDDEMFNATLVSFGSFGIIAGIMLEAEAKYQLECTRQRMPLTAAFRQVMDTLQLASLPLPHPDKMPWHFEVTFNPHDVGGGGYVRTMYKSKFDDSRPPNPPEQSGSIGPGEGLLSVVGALTEQVGAIGVNAALGLLVKNNLPLSTKPFIGACSEVFTTTTLRGRAMSMELGIDMANASKVLDLMLGLHPEIDVYAGVISYRWVKQGTALLGWTKFPITTTIEFNAAFNDRTLAFYNRLWDALESNNIPYTLHWGQMHNFTPDRVRRMYGNAVDQWLNVRDKLLSKEAKAVFSSKFLTTTGLG